MAEFDWTRPRPGFYPAYKQPPGLEITHPALFGFRIFLEDPKLQTYASQYSDSKVDPHNTLIDLILVWLVFGDGLLWCPTYESLLEGIIEITANWLENDRITVTHPEALLFVDGEDEPPKFRLLAWYCEGADARLRFCEEDTIPRVLSARAFARIKVAHAALLPRVHLQ